jgi:hypothetical protein
MNSFIGSHNRVQEVLDRGRSLMAKRTKSVFRLG